MEHRAAAGHNEAVLPDIRREFRRGDLQDLLHGGDDLHHLLHQRVIDIAGADHKLFRQAGVQVASLGLHLLILGIEDTAHLDLDALCHLLADEDIPVGADAAAQWPRPACACQLDGLLADDAVEGQHSNIRSTAAHIQDKPSPGTERSSPAPSAAATGSSMR